MRPMPNLKRASPLLVIFAGLAALVCLLGPDERARAEGAVSVSAAARKAAATGKSVATTNPEKPQKPAKSATSATTGSSMKSSRSAAARKPAPLGGFMPLPGAKGRAFSYWERDGGPVDMKDPWRKLNTDGQHDPASDAVKLLQQPVEAMRSLPRAANGNFVDWVAAVKNRAITPRAEADKEGQMKLLNSETILRNTRTMPTVTFSHAVHTEWLACSNCHNELFKDKPGANVIRMSDIFKGEACGACHGKVAFPPDQCFRCHNGPRRQAQE